MQTCPSNHAGLLIIRAWIEGPEERFVARITHTVDVVQEHSTVSVVGSVEEAYEAVRAWLDAFQPSSPSPSND